VTLQYDTAASRSSTEINFRIMLGSDYGEMHFGRKKRRCRAGPGRPKEWRKTRLISDPAEHLQRLD